MNPRLLEQEDHTSGFFASRAHRSNLGETGFAKPIPNRSELKIIASAGHGVHIGKPEETLKPTVKFLAK